MIKNDSLLTTRPKIFAISLVETYDPFDLLDAFQLLFLKDNLFQQE